MADGAIAESPRRAHALPSKWLPIAISAVAAGLLLALAYYGLQFFRKSTFEDERSFRILGELIGQFGNLQRTLSSINPPAAPPRDAAKDEAQWEKAWLARVALPGIHGVKLADGDCASLSTDGVLVVHTNDPTRRTEMARCEQSQKRPFVLHGNLVEQVAAFVTQEFFDTAIIALKDGTVLATIPRSHRNRARVELQQSSAQGLIITDVRALLRHAAKTDATTGNGPKKAGDSKEGDSKEGSSQDPVPGYPTVFSESIAGEDYRVFVQPFEAQLPLMSAPAKGSEQATELASPLYMIGVQRENMLGSMTDALGSTGVLLITCASLLIVLAWPLLSLKFGGPLEPISQMQLFTVLAALLLLPALLTIAGFSVWSRHRLTSWADRSAEVYAREVETELLTELSGDVHTLDVLAAQIGPRFVEREPTLSTSADLCAGSVERCEYLPPDNRELPGWSTLRAATAVSEAGTSFGFTINLFGAPATARLVDIHDRDYFQAIRNGEVWRPDDLWKSEPWTALGLATPAHGFVAQRLFNRSDAARVLQIAVPMSYGPGKAGLVTGDSRMDALTKAVRPPLLRFAIVDADNGAVILHSDDERSLTENLLIETEQNFELRSAMRKRAATRNIDRVASADHFNGRYVGKPHRFYYRPVSGMPWGIVVFYSAESLSAIALQTAVATLATYFAFAAAFILLLTVLVLLLPGRPDLDILAFIWPKWGSRDRYRVFAPSTALALALWLLVGLLWPDLGLALPLVGAAIIAAAVIVTRSFGARPREKSQVTTLASYQNHYVGSMLCVVAAMAVIPTAWLAIEYHDISVGAFVRDELAQAADDIDGRYYALARDADRFAVGLPRDTLPSASDLSIKLPVPGFAAPGSAQDEATEWRLHDVQPGLWLTTSEPRLGSMRRAIWTMSTSRHAPRQRANTTDNTSQDDERRAQPEDQETRYWRRNDRGGRVKVVLPRAVASCGGAKAPACLRHDAGLRQHYDWSDRLILSAIILATVLLLTVMCWHVARRLFGVRIPFAARLLETTPPYGAAELLQTEAELLDLKKNVVGMTAKDEQEWRAARCENIYRKMWQELRAEEQLLIQQLARGAFANPQNRATIEQLLRRGYLKLWPWPRIAESGFGEYVGSLPPEQPTVELERVAGQNLWHRIRTPLLVVVIVVAGLLMWFAGSAMQILSATLAGMAGLFGSVTTVTKFIRSDDKK
jgi:hypothetical protein